jgi:hypothetical protein
MYSFDLSTFWKDHWIMIASRILLTVVGLLLSLARLRAAAFLRNTIFASKHQQQLQLDHQHNWLEDQQFVKSFGELHDELQSEDSQHLLQEYNDKEPHVTHFLFLVHGYHGFSQVCTCAFASILHAHAYASAYICVGSCILHIIVV